MPVAHLDVADGVAVVKHLLDLLQNERELRVKKEIELKAIETKMTKLVGREVKEKKAKGRRPSIDISLQ